MITESENIHRLQYEEKEVLLVGTAHVSRESVDLVARVIEEEKPDTVCIELCASRYQAITQENQWQNTNILKVIKEKKAFLLLANLMLASFQKRIGKKFGVKPGEEMIQAIHSAEAIGAHVHLADRDVRTTLSRTWRLMRFRSKIKVLAELMTSFGALDDIKEEDIENMKNRDVLETLLTEVGDALPEIRSILIDERDQYLAQKIRSAPGRKIVAVVGAGHVPGIQKYWEAPIDMDELEQIPPKGKLFNVLKWGLPLMILGLMASGFYSAGTASGTDMIKWWVLANAILAGLGATIALGHPVTILSAAFAAPITSLNPMIAAGWVSGLVEAFLRKPRVVDFQELPEDISSLKGFWRNKITRILLVVVLTNMGSAVGTFVAIPMMLKFIS
ncbi:TraB/GumN family protein [Desulforhabdus amnigena]|jgi:pheromone shutdown-related protein TraB|uniref:Conjugal transfer protein TraB n=1 Tax=Desulforhabdus amnigena TaxID=40218 RepID=A0A9W6D2Y5_9BACT|nr:TraB/GumN family protein [Desulforhabdus amnigena]NLJ27818.1 TraB/GumN family protein [Deltaproteobacteria bacterium]GLI33252.1 conjugal transfer protein TraB [Desulforhabdus amnigena]